LPLLTPSLIRLKASSGAARTPEACTHVSKMRRRRKRKYQSAAMHEDRGVVRMQGEVVKNQGTASTNMDGSEKVKNDHLQELEKERAPNLQEQGGDDKKRKHEQVQEPELSSDQLHVNNQALKRCKEEFIEEDHAAFMQLMSAVEAVAQCSICRDTMKQASTVSGCGHTFCRSCIEEAVRVTGCCPECLLPAWHCDIMDSRRVNGLIEGAAAAAACSELP
jgi:hypothetical protein